MTAKEFLNQAYRIENMIDVKLDQLKIYKALSTKATSALSASPRTGTPNIHRMEDIIIKMVDLENEIILSLDKLLDTRLEISAAIDNIPCKEYRMILELRYLCYMPWSEIAAKLKYSKQHTFRLHDEALKEVILKNKDESKIY